MVHRDIKAGNVLVRTDTAQSLPSPVLVDFGLACAPNALRVTQGGVLVGTPTHWAPEYVAFGQGKVSSSEGIGPPADLYGLGVVLYELLTGDVPFRGDSLGELLRCIRAEPPMPPSLLRPGLPSGLERLVLSLLAKDPRHRPKGGGEVAARLEQEVGLLGS